MIVLDFCGLIGGGLELSSPDGGVENVGKLSKLTAEEKLQLESSTISSKITSGTLEGASTSEGRSSKCTFNSLD